MSMSFAVRLEFTMEKWEVDLFEFVLMLNAANMVGCTPSAIIEESKINYCF